MNQIIDFLSTILGFLMDFFFRGLTFIGYPRLWLSIVLFAITTRILFLPQRINSQRKKLLEPVVKKELLSLDPTFFDKSTDKEVNKKRAALKKQVNKKYKISNSSGCLTTLIQYPLLVALFYVVSEPQNYVPSLQSLSSVSPQVNSFLGISLSAVPLDNIAFNSIEALTLCVPLLIVVSNFLKMLPSFKSAKTISQKIKASLLFALTGLLLGWVSAKLPIAISLYWLTNDLTLFVFDLIIHKVLPKTRTISRILHYHNTEKPSEILADSNSECIEAGEVETKV